jgi:hypothetical protein
MAQAIKWARFTKPLPALPKKKIPASFQKYRDSIK